MLKEFIDQFYLDREKEKKEKERVRFYISEAGKCPRSIFFKFKGAPAKEIEAERLRVLDHGDYIHQLILKPLFSLGLVRASEVSIPPQQVIAGRADAIISLEGQPYVLDIKSISGRMNLEKMEKPMPEHYWQVQLYLHYFKIPKGILLYVNKDTLKLKEFVFDYKSEVAGELLNWFEKLKSKVESNMIPTRLSDYPDNWQCQNCQYFEICQISGEKELNWEDFKRKIESSPPFQSIE